MENNYDHFESIFRVKMFDFEFMSSYYKIWQQGRLIDSKQQNVLIKGIVSKSIWEEEKLKIYVRDVDSQNVIEKLSVYDALITSTDRLQAVTIPENTNNEIMAFFFFRQSVGNTCKEKFFTKTQSFCCNMFFRNDEIVKLAFSFSNPERMVEFYHSSH